MRWTRRTIGLLALVALVAACQSGGGGGSQAKTTPITHGPTWSSVDLPGQGGDWRAGAFDSRRDVLWVLSREFHGNTLLAILTRIDVDSRVETTALTFEDGEFERPAIAVDSHGIVWMAVGFQLVSFDPATGKEQAWRRPTYNGLARLYSGDAREEALTIDSSGEVWIVANQVSGLFGFLPSKNAWDKTINLPFVPTLESTLASPRPGVVLVNGGTLDQPYGKPALGVVNTATRAVRVLPVETTDYLVTSPSTIEFPDTHDQLMELDIETGASRVVARLPIFGAMGEPAHDLALDEHGDVVFQFRTDSAAGIAVSNPSPGQGPTQFPYPPIKSSRAMSPHECPIFDGPRPPGPQLPPCFCTSRYFPCKVPKVFYQPSVDAIVVDSRGDIWVVTAQPAMNNPYRGPQPFGPVLELRMSA